MIPLNEDYIGIVGNFRPASALPRAGEMVLLRLQSGSTTSMVVGLHYPRFFLEDNNDFEGDLESKGHKSYWPEGFYEQNLHGGEHNLWRIPDREVVAWMPLPRYEP